MVGEQLHAGMCQCPDTCKVKIIGHLQSLLITTILLNTDI